METPSLRTRGRLLPRDRSGLEPGPDSNVGGLSPCSWAVSYDLLEGAVRKLSCEFQVPRAPLPRREDPPAPSSRSPL